MRVDASLYTNRPDMYAAGEVASFHNLLSMGAVDDCIMDDESWVLRSMVVEM